MSTMATREKNGASMRVIIGAETVGGVIPRRVFTDSETAEEWASGNGSRSLFGEYRVDSSPFRVSPVQDTGTVFVGVNMMDGIICQVLSNQSSAELWCKKNGDREWFRFDV